MNYLTGARRNLALILGAALGGFSCAGDHGATVFLPPAPAPAAEVESVAQSEPATPPEQRPPLAEPVEQPPVRPARQLSPQQVEVERGLRESELAAYRQTLTPAEMAEAEQPALEAEETALIDEISEGQTGTDTITIPHPTSGTNPS